MKAKLYISLAVVILSLSALVIAAVLLFRSSNYLAHKRTTYKEAPTFLGSVASELRPVSLSYDRGRLYVCYQSSNRVDVLSPQGKLLSSIKLPQGVQPRDIAVGKGRIFVADKTGEIKIFTEGGKSINSYGLLPEREGVIRAASVHLDRDRLYVADTNLPGILVVSAVTIYGQTQQGGRVPLTEEGELILTITDLKKPSCAIVSPDGRVLVSDTDLRMVKVYTCTGRYAYPFESGKGENRLVAPQAMVYDNLSNPEYEKSKKSFDPSGIRKHGRVHVVDKAKNRVFVYTTTGNFLFSYGRNELASPEGIAIDASHRLIFITDTGHRRVAVWGY